MQNEQFENGSQFMSTDSTDQALLKQEQQLKMLQETVDEAMPQLDLSPNHLKRSSSSSMECNSAPSKLRLSEAKKVLNPASRKQNEKERKARQLRRFRKWLIPKNAIVALHELQGPGMTEFVVNTNGQETKAEIVINNVKYEATAPNKNLAKAKASEKALRDIAFAQLTRVKQLRKTALAQQQKANQTAGSEESNDNADGSVTDVEMHDVIESGDMPMEHLAAFALHKLFTQWEAEGFEMPFIKPARAKIGATVTETGPSSILPKVTKTVADLPPDAAMRHPTSLFAYMRPQVAYEDMGVNNDQVNREFIAGIHVDGQHFVGKGRSKKLARKAAAIDACKALFNVEFDKSVLQA